jgi:hypothetical protein
LEPEEVPTVAAPTAVSPDVMRELRRRQKELADKRKFFESGIFTPTTTPQ